MPDIFLKNDLDELRSFYRTGQHRTQVTKHTNKGNQSGSETMARHHQMPKTGVSVVQQKGLMSSKMLEKLLYIILTTPDEDISRHSSGVRPMEASAGSSTAMIDWLTRPDKWVRTVFRCRQWASPTGKISKVRWIKRSRHDWTLKRL